MEKIKLGEFFRGLEPPKLPAPKPEPVVSSMAEPVWITKCQTCSGARAPEVLMKNRANTLEYQVCIRCWDKHPSWHTEWRVAAKRSLLPTPSLSVSLTPCSYPTHRHNRPRKSPCGPCGIVNRLTGDVCTRGQFHANEHHAMDYATGRCKGEWR